MRLSKNFWLKEFTVSRDATPCLIDNEPNERQIKNIKHLVKKVLQPLRNFFATKILVTSGYRSTLLNEVVGGVKNSHHLCLENYAAADIIVVGKLAEHVLSTIKTLDLPIEQAIDFSHYYIHVSARRPKKQFLKKIKKPCDEDDAVYVPAL